MHRQTVRERPVEQALGRHSVLSQVFLGAVTLRGIQYGLGESRSVCASKSKRPFENWPSSFNLFRQRGLRSHNAGQTY
uniref:Uncharacterized protein n=1 Tax=Anguilla anguilla TaxID=7936 RepID=A0A0E9QIK6_ANGAN